MIIVARYHPIGIHSTLSQNTICAHILPPSGSTNKMRKKVQAQNITFPGVQEKKTMIDCSSSVISTYYKPNFTTNRNRKAAKQFLPLGICEIKMLLIA